MPELRTRALVLRRTNVGETDRIINLLTPEGQKSVKAKGVRKEKSRLAGGIEMFCLSDVVIHEGRSELGVLTSAKMLKFYANILSDFTKLELASSMLKDVNRASHHIDNPEFFSITEQALSAINDGLELSLIHVWFLINLARATGLEPNLHRDHAGQKLDIGGRYHWDSLDGALVLDERGSIQASHIKLMRLMLSASLATVAKVQNVAPLLPDILHIAKSWYN